MRTAFRADRYELNANTIHSRAPSDGWCQRTFDAVATPLHPHLDPAQVAELGDPVWPKGAHAAQLPPEEAWATYLLRGGRGAGWLAAPAEWTPGGGSR